MVGVLSWIVIAVMAGKTILPDIVHEDPDIAISVITEIELLFFGRLSASEEKEIRAFLAETEIIYINHAIKDTSIIFPAPPV